MVTIADILLPDYGINKNAGLRVEEWPRAIHFSPELRIYVECIWDHRCFEPLKSLDFWVGEKAAKGLKKTRDEKVPQPADGNRRAKVPVKERSGALDHPAPARKGWTYF